MNYSFHSEPDKTVFSLEGDLDIEAMEWMEQQLLPHMMQQSCIEIRLNKVPFVDSTGIGLLIQAVQTLQELDKKVTVTGIRSDVLVVFLLLSIPEILGRDVFPELDAKHG